jgi:hypothetical protein
MIPYLLAAVGGYLLGDSMKESEKFADGGGVNPNWRNPENIKVGDIVKLTTIGRTKGIVVDIIQSPAPFVSTAKIDWDDKKDRGLVYVTHIQKYAHGGILDNADIEVEMESMNSNTLVLEVEIYDGTKEDKYFFEYSIDHSDSSCSLDAIYDENNNKVSKELQSELESNKSLDNQLDNAIRDAFDKYADERDESRRDYEEE